MRGITIAAAVMVLCAQQVQAQGSDDRFGGAARRHDYVRAVIGPTALLGIAAATALDEIRDDPREWDFADRALSNAGRLVVQETIHHGIAAVMDRSTSYYRCSCSGTGARIGHAFAEAITDHDRASRTHFSIARVAGAYGGVAAETTWRPGRRTGDILIAGTTTLLASGIVNLWRELAH